ncbi:MAG: DUF72 domain-containing protein [Paracoccus sp. (in: a-proteobacteria)]|nr:DUF72 domain-containing protein [Paracoccus sp. (in: a-proteobacteria)]
MTRPVRIGIGGWSCPEWRGSFYPPGLPQRHELECARRTLPTIGINATYYGSPKPESFARWRSEPPEGFIFAVKGPGFATSRRDLAGTGDAVARFLDSGVTALGDRLGPINWQLGATKQFDPAEMAVFIALLADSHGGVALRHALGSFCDPAFASLCRARPRHHPRHRQPLSRDCRRYGRFHLSAHDGPRSRRAMRPAILTG